MLSRVFYKSQSAYPVGHASDVDILNTAISRNEVHDLTGFLLRGKHWFAQCLEGPRAELETVFQLIIADQRHFDVQDMWSHQLPDREFGDWCMAMATVPMPHTQGFLSLDDPRVSITEKIGLMIKASRQYKIKY